MHRNARPTTWHGTDDCEKGWRIFGHSSLERWLYSFYFIYKWGMNCNERFGWQFLFHVVFIRSKQTKCIFRFKFCVTIGFMFIKVEMFIINLDYCIVFPMILFIPSFFKTIYDSIDTLFVLMYFLHFSKQGTKKVEGILYKRSQYHLQGWNYCLDLELSNLWLLLIHDYIDNASIDFQLFKAPLSQVGIHLCQLKAIFINDKFEQLPKQLWELHSLKSIDIEGLKMVKTLHEGLGNLTSLTHLNLRSCNNLRTWPEKLGNLTSLTELNLSNCSSLTTLPEGLGNLTSLMKLDLSFCSSMTTLPKGSENMTSLRELYLANYTSLTTFLNRLRNLTYLMELYLSCYPSLITLPEGLGNLISLTKLDLSMCSSLTTLPEGLGNLTFLTEQNFHKLFKLDDITTWTWKPHIFEKANNMGMFKLDNITRGNQKPNFFDNILI